MKLIASIDQGTTSTRCIFFDKKGEIVSVAQKEHEQIYPQPGWVEHNPEEIWKNTQEVIAQARIKKDTRVGKTVEKLEKEIGSDWIRAKTGLPLATYFSGLKIQWLLENVDGLREDAEKGEAIFGNMDTFLVWNLTGGIKGGIHITDVTNASRTQLMNLETQTWDDEILQKLNIPKAMLPEIKPSSMKYGDITAEPLAGVPIAGILGDQQAALVGQTCFKPGEAKNTYGTGSVAIAGALVQWVRDNLGLIKESSEIQTLAEGVEDNGGAYFVPAFSGLYAPYWENSARGVVAAYQTLDVLEAMEKDAGLEITSLRVDGGMTTNDD
eukprot:gene24782-31158_t